MIKVIKKLIKTRKNNKRIANRESPGSASSFTFCKI